MIILLNEGRDPVTWKIGDAKLFPIPAVSAITTETDEEIYHIVDCFTHDTLTIPLPRETQYITWYGCIAQTILSNL